MNDEYLMSLLEYRTIARIKDIAFSVTIPLDIQVWSKDMVVVTGQLLLVNSLKGLNGIE